MPCRLCESRCLETEMHGQVADLVLSALLGQKEAHEGEADHAQFGRLGQEESYQGEADLVRPGRLGQKEAHEGQGQAGAAANNVVAVLPRRAQALQ